MKLNYSFFLLFALLTQSTLAQNSVQSNITSFAQIEFPVESERIETEREIVYKATDSTAIYIVGVRKLSSSQTALLTEKEIPMLYRGVIDGSINAASGKLISVNEINIQGIPAIDAVYEAATNPSKLPALRYKRVIYYNETILLIDFWPITTDEKIINTQKKSFFNSFKIIPQQETTQLLKQNNLKSDAEQFGFYMGIITFVVVLILILLIFFLFIKFLIKKSKKSKIKIKDQPQSVVAQSVCKNCNTENKISSKYCLRCGFQI